MVFWQLISQWKVFYPYVVLKLSVETFSKKIFQCNITILGFTKTEYATRSYKSDTLVSRDGIDNNQVKCDRTVESIVNGTTQAIFSALHWMNPLVTRQTKK